MNYTESFDQFASRVSSMDLALYAGLGLVLWILFKDRLSPVQKFITDLLNNIKSHPVSIAPSVPNLSNQDNNDVFFKLIASWKQTRDLAVQSNCTEAVKVVDQIFPYLSPQSCSEVVQSSNDTVTKK